MNKASSITNELVGQVLEAIEKLGTATVDELCDALGIDKRYDSIVRGAAWVLIDRGKIDTTLDRRFTFVRR